uniref:helix-turn-helix domain-containing protein n=1 Tax=Streptomyces rimosus TaxID=1927 RepID=UPI00373FE05C
MKIGGPTHGRRLAETLLAWLETRGSAPEVAARLGVHLQTVRYRLRGELSVPGRPSCPR